MAKNMGNFIYVPREIFEVDKFGREPYSKREAFLDLVQMAAYEDSEIFVNGYRYERSRGDVIVSKGFLSKRWGWSVDKVRRYTTYLERNGWCKCRRDDQCNQPITLISIVSYDVYQGCTTTPDTTDDTTPATTSGSTPDTQYKEKEIEKTNKKGGESAPKKREVFVKPSIDEIADFCKEKGYDVDAERFFNYYESKGWLVGKSPMKDWKAAVRTWASNQKSFSASSSSQPSSSPQVAPTPSSKEADMYKATHPTKEEINKKYREFFMPSYPPNEGESNEAYNERIKPFWERFYANWIEDRIQAVNNKY